MVTTNYNPSVAAGWQIMMTKPGCLTHRVPEQYRDIKLLVTFNGLNLKTVPVEDRTDELCELAVRNTHLALEFVPFGKRSRELCMIAFDKDPWAILNIPSEHLTDEMCHRFIKGGKATFSQLQAVPQSFQTPELKRLAVESWGFNLQYLVESERTDELCLLALKTFGCAIDDFPKTSKLRSSVEVNLEAIRQDGSALRFATVAPTDEMYAIAVASRGCMLRLVPKEKRTRALIESALKNEGGALAYVEEDKRTADLCRMAVSSVRPSWALEHVPEPMKTVELCVESVRSSWHMYRFVPDEIKVAVDFVEVNPSVFWYVDKTFDNCKAFLKKYGDIYPLMHHCFPDEFICAELFDS